MIRWLRVFTTHDFWESIYYNNDDNIFTVIYSRQCFDKAKQPGASIHSLFPKYVSAFCIDNMKLFDLTRWLHCLNHPHYHSQLLFTFPAFLSASLALKLARFFFTLAILENNTINVVRCAYRPSWVLILLGVKELPIMFVLNDGMHESVPFRLCVSMSRESCGEMRAFGL